MKRLFKIFSIIILAGIILVIFSVTGKPVYAQRGGYLWNWIGTGGLQNAIGSGALQNWVGSGAAWNYVGSGTWWNYVGSQGGGFYGLAQSFLQDRGYWWAQRRR